MDAFSGPVTIVAVMGNVWMAGFDDFLMLLRPHQHQPGRDESSLLGDYGRRSPDVPFIEKGCAAGPLSGRKRELIQKGATIFFIGFFVFIIP